MKLPTINLNLGSLRFPSRAQLLLYGIYAAIFSISFVVFAYFTFPYDRLRDYIVQEVEAPAGPTGERRSGEWELEIVGLGPSWGTGVEMEGVRIARRPTPGEEEGPPAEVLIDELTAHVSLLSLLFGSRDVSFDAHFAGGDVEGEIEQSDEATEIALELDRVNLRQIGLIRSFVGLPMTGVITGNVSMNLPAELEKSSGAIRLQISQLSIGDGRAKLKLPGFQDGLTVQRVSAGTLEVDATITEGEIEFQKFASNGDDLELSCEGSVTLRRPMNASRLNLLLKVKLTEAYMQKDPRLAGLMEFEPSLSRAKTPDGALQYQLRGTFGGRIVPTPAGGARGAPAERRRP